MQLRRRRTVDGDKPLTNSPTDDSTGSEGLRDFRSQGEGLLEACDRAISRALSGDSRDFLRRSQQEGGQ